MDHPFLHALRALGGGEATLPEAFLPHLARIIEHGRDGLALVDRRGIVRSWSAGAERMFGYSAEEVVGREAALLLPPHLLEAGEWERLERQLARDGLVQAHRALRVAKDGQPLLIELTCLALHDGAGELAGHTQLYRDLSEAARMERQMHQSQRLVTVAQLVAGLAHEIGTPLNVISGRAELLLQTLGEDDARREDLQVIMRESERVAEMVRALLAFARGSREAHRRRCSLNEAMQEVLRLAGPQLRVASIEVRSELAPGLPLLVANRSQLMQIGLNLVFNAQQAMPGGGVLDLQTAREMDQEGEWLVLRVSDSGVGIAPEHYGKLFEPFFSTKPPGKGTGLGLTVVSGIVEQYHGRIAFESELGKGATFRVAFPCERP